ncbi:hypothetical protein QFZ56_003399 [Streptomyces achromogenes]|uniref:Uncharacterized protein n=1 Tax=Streptomyces achromogenes TaxID=67255 RepID=A0ABU0Q255_STRAH|nr:hypothetical protein [Streptomyces achromogenes]
MRDRNLTSLLSREVERKGLLYSADNLDQLSRDRDELPHGNCPATFDTSCTPSPTPLRLRQSLHGHSRSAAKWSNGTHVQPYRLAHRPAFVLFRMRVPIAYRSRLSLCSRLQRRRAGDLRGGFLSWQANVQPQPGHALHGSTPGTPQTGAGSTPVAHHASTESVQIERCQRKKRHLQSLRLSGPEVAQPSSHGPPNRPGSRHCNCPMAPLSVSPSSLPRSVLARLVQHYHNSPALGAECWERQGVL